MIVVVVEVEVDDDTFSLMLGLHRIATNLGLIYELKNSGFLGLSR